MKYPDVPRTANDWPTVEPKFFSLDQLIREAQRWISGASNEKGTVSRREWEKYTKELVERGFIREYHLDEWRLRKVSPTIFKENNEWRVKFGK